MAEPSGLVPSVELGPWSGPWSDDDSDANFKADVALYARYVLAKWATAGSGGLLELGPTMIHRLWQPVADAEAAGTDDARLKAYDQVRQMLAWLRLPLVDANAAGYGDDNAGG